MTPPRDRAPGCALLHPFAVLSLVVLVANDHWLKHAHPGLLSGKLSGFAAVLLLPLFLHTLFELSYRAVNARRPSARLANRALGACLALTCSVYAPPEIWPPAETAYRYGLGALQWPFRALWSVGHGQGAVGLVPVRATADPSDLAALVMLWVAWRVARRAPGTKGVIRTRPGLEPALAAIAALCGLGVALTSALSGCTIGAECAPTLGDEDECNATEVHCVDATHIASCVTTHCDATWGASRACPSSTPYCVQTSTSALRAECATEPSCAATTDACGSRGLCSDGDGNGQCVLTAAGCAATCADHGRCGFDGTKCIATPEGCAASTQCKTEGTCRELNGFCYGSLEDCAASTNACGNDGLCGYENDRCAPTEAGCAASSECALSGFCAHGGDRCVATEAGCAASEACAKWKQCLLKAGECSY